VSNKNKNKTLLLQKINKYILNFLAFKFYRHELKNLRFSCIRGHSKFQILFNRFEVLKKSWHKFISEMFILKDHLFSNKKFIFQIH